MFVFSCSQRCSSYPIERIFLSLSRLRFIYISSPSLTENTANMKSKNKLGKKIPAHFKTRNKQNEKFLKLKPRGRNNYHQALKGLGISSPL